MNDNIRICSVPERDQSLTTGQLPAQHLLTAAAAAAQGTAGLQAGHGEEAEVGLQRNRRMSPFIFAF